MNGFLYGYVALVLQASQAHNITVPGCHKYNVPTGNITIDDTLETSSPNRTSYTTEAIAGADDINDGSATIRDVFDGIVEITREVTPTCKSLLSRSLCSSADPSPAKSEPCGARGTHQRNFIRVCSDDIFSLSRSFTYGWPIRSVERLPPYSPKQLKYPVLVIGNTVRALYVVGFLFPDLEIPRRTLSRHSRVRKRPPTYSATILS